MLRSINDLTEKEFNILSTCLAVQLRTETKGLLNLAEKYKLDKNELFDYWLFTAEKFKNSGDLNKKKGLTVDEGLKLIKSILNLKGE